MARRRSRRDRRRLSPVAAGALFLAIAAIVTYLGFTKGQLPWMHDFKVRAVVENADSIKANSPVRIAGVNVGTVTGVEPYRDTDLSVVTFELQDRGLPIRRDARVRIRPRTFLEGNFIVELQPGSPSAPTMAEDQTIPVTQTSGPVRFDEVLTSLQSDTRDDLKQAVDELGTALTSRPDETSGEARISAARALNRSFDDAPTAFRDGSIVAEALRGRSGGDLGELIGRTGSLSTSLAANGADLRALLRRFDTTATALNEEQVSLRRTLRELPPTLREADGTFDALNASFPSVRGLARDLRPGIREIPATIDASRPFVRTTRRLLRPDALRGWVAEVRPGVRDLSQLNANARRLLPEVELLSKCLTRTILPAGDVKIENGRFTSGVENYKEFWYALTGLNSEGQNFDGNGNYVRFQVGGGDQTLALPGLAGGGATQLLGNFLQAPQGTRPAKPARQPPLRRDVDCFTQPVPDLNAARTGGADGGGSSVAQPRSGKVDVEAERARARRANDVGPATTPSAPADAGADDASGPAQAGSAEAAPQAPGPPAPGGSDAAEGGRGLTSGDGLAAELGKRLDPFAQGREGR